MNPQDVEEYMTRLGFRLRKRSHLYGHSTLGCVTDELAGLWYQQTLEARKDELTDAKRLLQHIVDPSLLSELNERLAELDQLLEPPTKERGE